VCNLTLRASPRPRVGYSGSRTGNFAPCIGATCGHLPAVFDSVLPKYCSARAANRTCVGVYVSSRMTAAAPFSPCLSVPPEVLSLKEQRGELSQTDCELRPAVATGNFLAETLNARTAAVNFSEYDSLPCGEVSLINRVKYAPFVPICRVFDDEKLFSQEPPRCSREALSRFVQALLPQWHANTRHSLLRNSLQNGREVTE
jgi:hypothetical protein